MICWSAQVLWMNYRSSLIEEVGRAPDGRIRFGSTWLTGKGKRCKYDRYEKALVSLGELPRVRLCW